MKTQHYIIDITLTKDNYKICFSTNTFTSKREGNNFCEKLLDLFDGEIQIPDFGVSLKMRKI